MSFVVHDYKCDHCELYERDQFVRRSEMYEIPCPECGENMRILPCIPKIDWDALAMGESASPEAIAHFERKHKEQAKLEERRKLEHGDYGKTPGS